jgi:hypothetical protein
MAVEHNPAEREHQEQEYPQGSDRLFISPDNESCDKERIYQTAD